MCQFKFNWVVLALSASCLALYVDPRPISAESWLAELGGPVLGLAAACGLVRELWPRRRDTRRGSRIMVNILLLACSPFALPRAWQVVSAISGRWHLVSVAILALVLGLLAGRLVFAGCGASSRRRIRSASSSPSRTGRRIAAN